MAIKGCNSNGQYRGGSAGGPVLDSINPIKDAYATAIGFGDPVAIGTAGNAGYLVLGSNAVVPIGILRGIEYIDVDGSWKTRKDFVATTTNFGNIDGFTDVKAIIEPIEGRVFSMVTSGTALTQAGVGLVYPLAAVGTIVNGQSQATVSTTAVATTEVMAVRVLGLTQVEGNAFGVGCVVDVEFLNAIGDAT